MNPVIALVTDEKTIVQAIQKELAGIPCTVCEAAAADQARTILTRQSPAVLICDPGRPNLDGTRILAEAGKCSRPPIRFVLATPAELQNAQQLISHKLADGFLVKPIQGDPLRRAVQDALCPKRAGSDSQCNPLNPVQVPLQMLCDLVKVLAGTLEAHSPRLGIHSKRVGETARRLGEHMGLGEQALRNVEFAAWLHEIGKTCRPIQSNPLASTIPTGQALLCYPETGFNLLTQIAGFEDVASGVRFQNEHYDGTGSPKGLSGESIPLAARIIAVVNAYDEAVFPAMNPAVVLRTPGIAALNQGSGKRFDPQIVATMQKHLIEITVSSGQDTEIEISVRQLLNGMTLSRDINTPDNGVPLQQGTRLTSEMISRLQSLALINPALGSLFICSSQHAIAEKLNSQGGSAKPATIDTNACHATTRQIEPKPEEAGTNGARRCLIVDDSHFIRTALCREMQRAGFETADTGDGRVALTWLEQSAYTLALVDLDMPSIRGADLIAHMLNYEPDMPCLVVTGRPNKEDLLRLSKMPNFAGLVVKPWSSDKLLDAVSLAIARRTQPAACAT